MTVNYYSIQKDILERDSYFSGNLGKVENFLRKEIEARVSSLAVGILFAATTFIGYMFGMAERAAYGVIALDKRCIKQTGLHFLGMVIVPCALFGVGVVGIFSPKKALDYGKELVDNHHEDVFSADFLGDCNQYSARLISPIRGVLLGATIITTTPLELVLDIFKKDTFKELNKDLSFLTFAVTSIYHGFAGIFSKDSRKELKFDN